MTVLRSLAFLLLLSPGLALARVQSTPPAPQNFRAEFFASLDEVQDKIVSLAEATPAAKFSWRPAPGVRSISETYMHVAGGNYILASFLGTRAPKTNGDLEKDVTKKNEVIAELKRSFEHLRSAVNNAGDLDSAVKMFGTPTTRRGVLLTILNHVHEHLGQSIAYARMNGIVPPWSH